MRTVRSRMARDVFGVWRGVAKIAAFAGRPQRSDGAGGVRADAARIARRGRRSAGGAGAPPPQAAGAARSGAVRAAVRGTARRFRAADRCVSRASAAKGGELGRRIGLGGPPSLRGFSLKCEGIPVLWNLKGLQAGKVSLPCGGPQAGPKWLARD